MKTAIWVDDSLMIEADRVAREIGVSRTRLFSLALKHYLEIVENQRIVERLNLVYANEPAKAEKRVTSELKRKFALTIKDSW